MTATARVIRAGTLLACFTTVPAGVSPAQSAPSYSRWLQEVKYNKSWIAIDWTALQGPLVEGDKIHLPVEYFLDPTEHFRTTSLKLEASAPACPSRAHAIRSRLITPSISGMATNRSRSHPGEAGMCFR